MCVWCSWLNFRLQRRPCVWIRHVGDSKTPTRMWTLSGDSVMKLPGMPLPLSSASKTMSWGSGT